jgi:Protein of unknown function (DUF3999)
MKYASIAFIILLSLLVMPIASFGEEDDAEAISNWTHKTPVIFDQAPDQGLVEFPMTRQASDLAKKDLSDLRLVEKESGQIVPFVMRRPRLHPKDNVLKSIRAKLFNRTYKPSRYTSVVAGFGAEVLKNKITITTPGNNFRRKVLIEGSDNAKVWEHVRDQAFLFSISAPWLPKGRFLKDTVEIPTNNQRYLRVSVFTGDDDPVKIEIKNISFTYEIKSPPSESPLPIKPISTHTEYLEKEKATILSIDLGYMNLPTDKVDLEFEEENFFRRVSVKGRDRETFIKTINTENGKIQKETEGPWKLIANSVIYRFPAGKKPDQKLDISLRNTSYRYLEIRIENRDDPPLTFKNAVATWYPRLISFQADQQASYALLLGNPKAKARSYDFRHYSERLREQGVTMVQLGDVAPNEDHAPQKPAKLPWHEQYSYALWLVLIAAAAVMAFLIFRLATNPPKED